jgi:hypothetical protein
MSTLAARLTDVQARLDALARQHRVPGAVLAVSQGDEVLDVATGVINSATGVAATPDTVFPDRVEHQAADHAGGPLRGRPPSRARPGAGRAARGRHGDRPESGRQPDGGRGDPGGRGDARGAAAGRAAARPAPRELRRNRLAIREPDWHQHRLLKGPDTDVNLHVHPPGSPEIGRNLGLRDHLRADAADRARYQAAKRELAGRHWTYVQQYADAKTDVIEDILRRSQAH